MNEIAALEAFGAELLARLEPAARTELARRIAKDLRASNQKRIAAQQAPDGTAYAPRKSQLRHRQGKIRAQMFSRLRTAKYLKAKAAQDAAIVAFADEVSRIARVHHFGLRDRVNRKTGLEVQYAERPLLGISADDEALIRDLAVAYIAGRE